MKQLDKFYYESPDGLKYDFEAKIQAQSGLGIIPIKFIEDYGPQQDGSTLRDWRMNSRTIDLDIFLQADDCCNTRGEQLANLINIIRPNRGRSRDVPGWLRFYNDAIVLMEIPVHVLQGASGNYKYNGDVGRYQVSDGIQFYAADPIWREVDKQSILTTFEEVEACLDTCLDYSVLVDSSTNPFCLTFTEALIQAIDVNYTGTWNGDQIDITLTGPMTNPIVYNLTQNTRIELLYAIKANETVTITIRPEYVTVKNNHDRNLIGTISSISDLVDFVLLSPGEVTPTGLNTLLVFAYDPDFEETQILIEYWTRHISAYGSPQC